MASSTTTSTARNRYEITQFKTTSAKRVPFEQLDYSIYKPSSNAVVFSTSERRIPLWITAFKSRYIEGLQNNDVLKSTWEETNDPSDTMKCEKVTITISHKLNIENLITININVNTGRIQIQGHFIKDWGSIEFERLGNIVNKPELNATPAASEEWEEFIGILLSNKKLKLHNEPLDDNQDINDLKKSFNTIKSNMANVEAELVNFKQTTNTNIEALTKCIETKEGDIQILKEEITI